MAELTKDDLQKALAEAQAERDKALAALAEKEAGEKAAAERVAELKAAQPPAYEPQPVQVVLQQPNPAAEGALNQIEGKRLAMDEAPRGGRYIVNGRVVDGNGQPVKGQAADGGGA